MEINNLYYLIFLLIPIGAVFFLKIGLAKRIHIFKALNLKLNLSSYKLSRTLMIIGLFLCTLSLLEPKIPGKEIPVERRGLDIFFLVDVSKSMLAEDIKPNRLTRAKESIKSLIRTLKGDRIGFIPFSSSAYIQMPLTEDYDMALLFLDSMDTEMISGGGTNIASAIEIALASFKRSSEGDRVLVIISDGEEHNPEAVAAAKKAKNAYIYTIGIGTSKGSLIPEVDSTGRVSDYKKDESGKYVMSRLNTKVLKEIADAGKGRFLRATLNGREIPQLIEHIAFLKRATLKEKKMQDYFHLYQFFLAIGIVLFLTGYFLTTGSGLKKWFKSKNIFIALLAFSLISCTQAEKDHARFEDGNELFRAKKYSEALKEYQTLSSKSKDAIHPALAYNLAGSYYALKKFPQAIKSYKKAGKDFETLLQTGNTLKRLGDGAKNGQEKMKNYQKALEFYKQAIILNSDHIRAKFNYEWVKKLLDNQKKQNQQQKKNQKDQNKKDKKQDKKKDSQEDKKDQQKKNQNKDKDQKQKDKKGQDKKEQNKKQQSGKDKENKKDPKKDKKNQGSKNKEQKDKNKTQKKMPKPSAQKLKQAMQVLRALQNKEKEDLKNNRKIQGKAQNNPQGKDW